MLRSVSMLSKVIFCMFAATYYPHGSMNCTNAAAAGIDELHDSYLCLVPSQEKQLVA